MAVPANKHPGDPAARGPRSLTPASEEARHLLQEVLAVLAKGSREEALRLFIQGTTGGLFPERAPLVRWLTEVGGKEAAARLADALAVHPCYYCQRGHALCKHCRGSGRAPVRGICDRCLGVGRAFCDFCNGSGWAAVDFVPAGLRRVVVLARVRLAMANMDRLLEQPLPAAGSRDLGRTRKACVEMLAALNRSMGALESVVIALKESVPAGRATPETIAMVTKACVRAVPLLDWRMKQVLGILADISRRRSLAAATPSAREINAHAAAFYMRLATDSFALTQLEHPFLRRLGRAGR